MTAFVILAAGRGSRIGRVGNHLHKALVPLGERAVLSRIIDLAPDDADVIICVGHRQEQIMEYVRLAHPKLRPTFVGVEEWDSAHGGPGWSLLAAQDAVGDRDMIFTSCDTLWRVDDIDGWHGTWAAVAPIPAGTPPERWCRIAVDDGGGALDILDKVPGGELGLAYTGLARIAQEDLEDFWEGVLQGRLVQGETQVSGGLARLARDGRLDTLPIHWTDVGDADAYAQAIALESGYDWTKTNEATYVLPEEGRVVKFWDDITAGNHSAERAEYIGSAVPRLVDRGQRMLAYEYVPGRTAYEHLDDMTRWVNIPTFVDRLTVWANAELWRPVEVEHAAFVAEDFYRTKTLRRIDMLEPELRRRAAAAVQRIDSETWHELCLDVQPVTFHGDFNYGNIIVTGDGEFVGIDWRADFGGYPWGDKRYDQAKLLAGTVVHWDRARRGDFRPWEDAATHKECILRTITPARRRHVEIIAALTLLNSAPLHAAPLDSILVARGTSWLEDVL